MLDANDFPEAGLEERLRGEAAKLRCAHGGGPPVDRLLAAHRRRIRLRRAAARSALAVFVLAAAAVATLQFSRTQTPAEPAVRGQRQASRPEDTKRAPKYPSAISPRRVARGATPENLEEDIYLIPIAVRYSVPLPASPHDSVAVPPERRIVHLEELSEFEQHAVRQVVGIDDPGALTDPL